MYGNKKNMKVIAYLLRNKRFICTVFKVFRFLKEILDEAPTMNQSHQQMNILVYFFFKRQIYHHQFERE